MFLLAGSVAVCTLLVLPSAYYAFRRITARPITQQPRLPALFRPTLLILLWPLVLLLGFWISQIEQIAWLLLTPLHILAVGLPILWLVYLAARHLPLGSPQRSWGVISTGLVLGPAIIMFLEILVLVFVGLAMIFFLASQPGLFNQLNDLVQSLQQGTLTEQELLQQIIPWLLRPGVILVILLFASLIVPLIEEALKPIGVWMLAGFRLTPAAGFVAGALSGAGFAFFESLALAGYGGEWTSAVVARLGAAIIHITNSAMMGWAIALAWQRKRYLVLGLTYLGVVAIHGLWNGLAIINLVEQAMRQLGQQAPSTMLSWFGPAAPFILIGVGIAVFVLLVWMNNRLRRSLPPEGGAPAPLVLDELASPGPAPSVL